jgi:hypothetical protein
MNKTDQPHKKDKEHWTWTQQHGFQIRSNTVKIKAYTC